ncbi:hypothetical protein DSO57_1034033 [Entomophthora muscae]|uniref:Uncharacterized protein n=1 Tax=Entomophthora muscae TaxID=34485 RepID=A0ACC2SP78_9FUNG|nr:hypothetical protein DSO57_1034033 [Entomophthora muscae]
MPLRTQTYVEVVAWTRPTIIPASKHQLPPVSSPERVMQLARSSDMVNHSGKIKHCHSCLPECTQPGTAALKTLRQDPCPTIKPPMDLKPAKSKEAKSHVIFHLNLGQVDNQTTTHSRDHPAKLPQALYCPPGAPFGPVHFTKYPPNPTYAKFNLENILLAKLLARNRETETIGHKGKWYIRPTRLFKDKYNYLPAYFVPMTPPLTVRNIPDNTLAQDTILVTIGPYKQNEKLQQFPLIGETAAKG